MTKHYMVMIDNNANSKRTNMGKIKNTAFAVLVMLMAIDGHSQVNLQTGSAVFSLPMFSWQDDKSRLNAMVALSYNSGNGLKVNDVASNVGQGWNLVAGGVITRMQVGEPDDQKARDASDLTSYPAGYLYNSVSVPEKGCPNALTGYPLYKDQNHLYRQNNFVGADKELDYFSYQFNGRSGMFVLGKNNGDYGISLGDNKLVIHFERQDMPNIRTTISAFTITDENGLTYRFDRIGTSKLLKTAYCDANLTMQLDQPHFSQYNAYHQSTFEDSTIVNPYVVGSWYLSRITDGLTNRTVYFGYDDHANNSTFVSGLSYNATKDYSIISHQVSEGTTPRLNSITCPDQHVVTFNYGADRIDLPGNQVLASVDAQYRGRYLSKFQLNTTYMLLNRIGNPVTGYQKRMARLCLQSVKRYGPDLADEDRPYIFDYYTGSSATGDVVPPPFSICKDVWGFYNGPNSAGSDGRAIPFDVDPSTMTDPNPVIKGLCFIRDNTTTQLLNPKDGYAKNGLLRQVAYPTGGALEYVYGQNYGTIIGQASQGMVGGVHVSQTRATDGDYTSGNNGCGNPIVTNYGFMLENGQSSLWGSEQPKTDMTNTSHYEREGRHFKPKLALFPATCGWDYQFPGILSSEQAFKLNDFQQFLSAVAPLLNLVSFYHEVVDLLAALDGDPINLIIDILGDIWGSVKDCSKEVKDESIHTYYNTDLNASNPYPSQFKRVEVGSSGGNGKTAYEFTSEDDYAVWVPSNPDRSMKQRFGPWAYGLPKKTTAYDNNGYPVKQTENIYSLTRMCEVYGVHHSPLGYVNCGPTKTALIDTSCNCLVNKSYSHSYTLWQDPNWYNPQPNGDYSGTADLTEDKYDMFTGRTELDTTYERAFNPQSSTQYLQTYTQYTYNAINYQPNQVTSQLSNGDVAQKNISYSIDNSGGIFTTMLQNNMVNEPVGVSAIVAKAGSPYYNQTLGATTTQYAQLPSGAIKPSSTLEQRYASPGASPTTVQTQSFMYDANSNLTGMKDEGSHMVANIYGYNDKYITGSVINADPVLDMPAYTSFEDGGLGGWTASGSPTYNTTSAVTGGISLNLSSVTGLTAPLNSAKAYKLSFWADNNSVSVGAGATLSKSTPMIGTYTYYEYAVPMGGSSITVSGNAGLDELRLYPADARMRTVTYDPVIGKTSECDENNRITYYTYDALGRLRLVKDENGHVVKMYEYAQSDKIQGCPGSYASHAATEYFTKNDCPTGYVGSDVAYAVPAGKYTSNISQWDADQQLENELVANGQAYANTNGNCLYVYQNAALSNTFTPESCGEGQKSADITYTVPQGRYNSTTSQADADAKAAFDAQANGQPYANRNAVCVVDNTPDWTGDDNSPTRCADGSTATPLGNKEMLMTDMNPNTGDPTSGQQQWKDIGPDASCTATPTTVNFAVTNNVQNSDIQGVTLVNTATNQAYYVGQVMWGFSSPPTQLPSGNYTVTVSWAHPQVTGHWFNFCGDLDFYNDTNTPTFYNVTISSNGCNLCVSDDNEVCGN